MMSGAALWIASTFAVGRMLQPLALEKKVGRTTPKIYVQRCQPFDHLPERIEPVFAVLSGHRELDRIVSSALLRRSAQDSADVDLLYIPCACISLCGHNGSASLSCRRIRPALGTFTAAILTLNGAHFRCMGEKPGAPNKEQFTADPHQLHRLVGPLVVLQHEAPDVRASWAPGDSIAIQTTKRLQTGTMATYQTPYPSSVAAWNGTSLTSVLPPDRRPHLVAFFASARGLFNRYAEPLRQQLEAECVAAGPRECVAASNHTDRHANRPILVSELLEGVVEGCGTTDGSLVAGGNQVKSLTTGLVYMDDCSRRLS